MREVEEEVWEEEGRVKRGVLKGVVIVIVVAVAVAVGIGVAALAFDICSYGSALSVARWEFF